MALGIRLTKITPLYPTRVFLQWDLTSPTEDGSYTFTVERSGSSEGPWAVLIAGLQNTYNYIDDLTDQPTLPDDGKANLFSLQRQIHYRVTVIPPSGCANQARAVASSPEKNLPPVQAGLRRRLQYDEQILFRRFNGVKLAILKRKRWGTRCTTCYDETTHTVINSHCDECYSTGFKDGFWDPVIVYGRVHPPTNVQAQTTQRDKQEAAQQRVTMLEVPIVEDRDLIVELDTNERHQVRGQVQTEIRRKVVHQQATVSTIERGSVEYTVPVDLRATPPIL
jgi:hypothetical protein